MTVVAPARAAYEHQLAILDTSPAARRLEVAA
jgi:hypothetical protein